MLIGTEKDDGLNKYMINSKKVFFYCNPKLRHVADFF